MQLLTLYTNSHSIFNCSLYIQIVPLSNCLITGCLKFLSHRWLLLSLALLCSLGAVCTPLILGPSLRSSPSSLLRSAPPGRNLRSSLTGGNVCPSSVGRSNALHYHRGAAFCAPLLDLLHCSHPPRGSSSSGAQFVFLFSSQTLIQLWAQSELLVFLDIILNTFDFCEWKK